MEHAPREPDLDHAGDGVGVPVGQRVVLLPSKEQPVPLVRSRRVHRAIPSDPRAVGLDCETVPAEVVMGQALPGAIVHLHGLGWVASRERHRAIEIVGLVDQHLARRGPREIDGELESDRASGAGMRKAPGAEVGTIGVDPDQITSLAPVDRADVEPEIDVGFVRRGTETPDGERRPRVGGWAGPRHAATAPVVASAVDDHG